MREMGRWGVGMQPGRGAWPLEAEKPKSHPGPFTLELCACELFNVSDTLGLFTLKMTRFTGLW